MDKPLQRIDHIMWDAETPNSLATIAGMMVFKKKLDKQKLTHVIEKRLLRYQRFQRKIIIKDGKPMWHLDEQFQLLTHIHHIALPGKGGYKELQECISDLISQPLNYNKPLWDIHLIDNYNGGCVLIWRLHHAIGDGMALVTVVFSLTSPSAKESLLAPEAIEPKSHNAVDQLLQLMDLGQNALDDAKYLFTHPSKLLEALKTDVLMAKEVGGLFFGKATNNKLYKGNVGITKRAAWTEPLPLEVFKRTAQLHKTKINDVVLALVAGAIRKHMLAHKLDIKSEVRITIPVNVRKTKEITSLHNEFSWISIDLPVHISRFEKRLANISQKTALLKPSAQSIFLSELIHVVADYTPMKPKLKLLEFLGKRITGTVTNVAGPKEPIYFAGAKVEELVSWIPHTVPLGIGISIISYNGKVYLSTAADEASINDPDFIVNEFTKEFKALEEKLHKLPTEKVKPVQ